MTAPRLALALLVLLLVSPPSAARPPVRERPAPASPVDEPPPGPHTFTHGPTGLSLSKPEAWFFLGSASVLENRQRARWSTDAWTEEMRGRAQLPLVSISMRADPGRHYGITPTVGVVASAAPRGLDAVQLLRIVLSTMAQALADLVVVEPVVRSTLGGAPAARLVVTYTLSTSTASFPVRATYLIVIRGDVAVIFAFAGPADATDHQSGFDAIARSVSWDGR